VPAQKARSAHLETMLSEACEVRPY
jgi:hypothetical protein